jgi:hypothetical protein
MGISEEIQWAEDEIRAAWDWAKSEVSLFSNGALTQLKLEVPAVTSLVARSLQDLLGQIVTSMEQAYTDGQMKWDTGFKTMIQIVENDGVAGMKLLMSTTLKETLLQDVASALKAGLLAADIVGSSAPPSA